MEQLLKEHERLEKKAHLGKAVEDVDTLIQQLKNTREAVARGLLSRKVPSWELS